MKDFHRLLRCLAALLITTSCVQAQTTPTPQQLEFFEKKVRPLFARHCYSCHSAKSKKLLAEFRLDYRQGLIKGGESGPAIVPGKPDESLLISAVKRESLEMPPSGNLSKAEIDTLIEWVRIGAPWPKEKVPVPTAEAKAFDWKSRKKQHWAWQAIANPDPPQVNAESWVRNAIDRFVLSKLEERQLSPAPEADRRTLIRRLYFDVIGLPPTTSEVQQFVADKSDNAYENLVDRLLAREQFGEKWARHWLDLVRYAETYGHEFDYPIHHASQYRDYVIRAFNADVPYDQFMTEHIAGDLMPDPRRHLTDGYNESVIGTGFWWFSEATHAPTDVRGDEAGRIDNQLDVMSKTFLGLTIGCARCHDHKFDAISTADYYALAGFLRSSRKNEALLDPQGKIAQAAAALRKINHEGTSEVRKAFRLGKLSGENFAAYLLATHEAVQLALQQPAENRADILFEDFEKEDYEGWTITGDAFGKAPSKGTNARQQPVTGFLGKGLVNTYQGTDGSQGTMTSREFTTERSYINFLIGGGHHVGRTCLNLVVEGKVVQTAVGRGPQDREKLSARSWPVKQWLGKSAKIQIIDRERGGWGHINVDHIVFSDKPQIATDVQILPDDEIIRAVAEKNQLDSRVLKRWVNALSNVKKSDTTHPLYAWRQLATNNRKTTDLFDNDVRALKSRLDRQTADAARSREDTVLFEDFRGESLNDWYTTGDAFAGNPTTPMDWSGMHGSLTSGVWHSGRRSNRLQGVLRSKTFTLNHNRILYRLNAKGASIRLIIDGYFMDVFNGLLFRGVSLKNVDTGGVFKWQVQAGDVGRYIGHRAHIEIIDHGDGFAAIDEIRFSNGPTPSASPSKISIAVLSGENINTLDSLAKAYGSVWDDIQKKEIDGLSESDESLANWAVGLGVGDAIEKLERLTEKAATLDAQLPRPLLAMALTDGNGLDENVFIRGSHKNLGPVASRQFITAIAGELQERIKSGSGRLELARRMADSSNPFPARVLVNRLWHHLFGRGIVSSVDDFGVMGQQPTHPKLLDWLAKDFVNNGWSTKQALKRILMSATYRMSSNPAADDGKAEQADPTNELFHRMPKRRLQAEAIRDSMLAISGRLSSKMYGPSVRVHLTQFMEGRGRPGSGPLDGDGRRSIYIETRRNFLPPMMLAFDQPSPFNTMGRRSVSNVPAQSLVLMNDPFVSQQAQLWAKNSLQQKDINVRIDNLFVSAFAHPPSQKQRKKVSDFVDRHAKMYGGNKDDARIWSDICHILINMKEFIFLN